MAERECTCGLPHDREGRRRILLRLLPASVQEISELFPCLWPRESGSPWAGRSLFRDLRAVGAVRFEGEWYAPGALERRGEERT